MDPPATADAPTSTSTSLRKRANALSVNTPSGSRERESKARQDAAVGTMEDVERRGAEEEQPMSPAGRLFRETHFNCYIVALLGLGAPVDLAAARAGLDATLIRHPRFSSVQVRSSLGCCLFPTTAGLLQLQLALKESNHSS